MPDFYFFTDTDLLQNQITGSYGPETTAGGGTKDRFRTTSIHSATNNSKAYAVCKGEILVQDTTNPTSGGPSLVNIILRPSSQPEFEIGFVKYYVYKGVLKDSLIDNTIPFQIAPRNTNDLTLKAWENQDKINVLVNRYYNNMPPASITMEPPASMLGIVYTATGIGNNLVADSEIVDKYFNRPSAEIQLLTMAAGDHIGDFDASNFGFEIIVEKIGYETTFEEVRQFEHFVEVTSLTGSSSDKEQFLHWFRKEEILCYLDPAAFFGSFYGYGLGAFTGGTEFTYDIDDLYDNCLANFANKNKVYLDIRNDFNYSLNAFGNYGRNIKLALDDDPSTTLTTYDYYSSGWPIMMLTSTDFGLMTNYDDRNLIRLQLPRGDNAMPIAYLDAVRTHTTFPKVIDNSFGAENKYGGLSIDVTADFMPIICYLMVPFHTTNGIPIATHNKLTVNKQLMNESAQVTTGTSLRSINYLDHLFFPKTLTNPLFDKYPNQTSWKVYEDYKYVDMFRFTGQEFMAKRGVAQNLDGSVVFFAFPQNKAISNNSIAFSKIPIKTQVLRKGTDFLNEMAQTLNAEYCRYDFERRGKTAYIEFLAKSPILNTAKTTYNLDDFVTISFTQEEFQSIEQTLNSTIPDLIEDLPISFYFQMTDDFAIPPTKDVYCLEYLVLLCAFFDDGSGGVETRFFSTDIYKYQLRTTPNFVNHPLLTTHFEENPVTDLLS